MDLNRIYSKETGELLPFWKNRLKIAEKADKYGPFAVTSVFIALFLLLMLVISPALEMYGLGAAVFSVTLAIVTMVFAVKAFKNWKDGLLPANFSGSMDDLSDKEIGKQIKTRKRDP